MTHKTEVPATEQALIISSMSWQLVQKTGLEIMAPSISLESSGTLEACFCRPCLGLLSVLPHLPPAMLTFLLDGPLVFPHPLILFAGLPVVEWPVWVALMACHFVLQIPGSAGPLEPTFKGRRLSVVCWDWPEDQEMLISYWLVATPFKSFKKNRCTEQSKLSEFFVAGALGPEGGEELQWPQLDHAEEAFFS